MSEELLQYSFRMETFIPCVLPLTTSQQKGAFATKGGGVRFFTKKKVKAAASELSTAIAPHAPPSPFAGPLCVILRLILPWRASEKKRVMRAFRSVPCDTRPDVDNRAKMVLDVMTDLNFWHDDGQIASLLLHKEYGDEPGIVLIITPARPTTRC